MNQNNNVGTELISELDKIIKKGELSKSLRQLLELNDDQLSIIMGPILSLKEFISKQEINKDNREHLTWMSGLYRNLIDMISSEKISWRNIQLQQHLYNEQLKAMRYLPEPFCNSQQIMGAIALMSKVGYGRFIYNLSQIALRWEEALGKPVFHNIDFLEKYPFLMPIAFSAGKWMELIVKNPQQYYGHQPALNPRFSTDSIIASYKKWPLENFYAFCPLPSWAADSNGKKLWLENCTWSEQQAELLRLQRKHPQMTVRFARLPELVFLDLSLRLATLGSPMEIYSFRCENPIDGANCLTYGGVSDSGAEIREEKNSTNQEHKVLPLFIIKSEKKKSKNK